jgi:hypothetical protein
MANANSNHTEYIPLGDPVADRAPRTLANVEALVAQSAVFSVTVDGVAATYLDVTECDQDDIAEYRSGNCYSFWTIGTGEDR